MDKLADTSTLSLACLLLPHNFHPELLQQAGTGFVCPEGRCKLIINIYEMIMIQDCAALKQLQTSGCGVPVAVFHCRVLATQLNCSTTF